MKDLTGIILSGGNSVRMGQDKGLVEIKGKKMIEHVISNIKPLCKHILISSNNKEYEQFGLPVIPDQWIDFGPAAGIQSCLERSETATNLVISCDLPLATTDMLRDLYEYSLFAEVTVPRVNTRIQPLCGYYTTNIRNKFRELLVGGEKSPQYLIQNFNLRIISQEMLPGHDMEKLLKNFNEPGDIREYLESVDNE